MAESVDKFLTDRRSPVLVLVPVSVPELIDLAHGRPLRSRPVWAATPALAAELECGPEESETVEWSALVFASVDGLARHGVRLVITAQAHLEGEAEPGRGYVTDLTWSAVTAVFADPPTAAPALAVLGSRVAGLDFDTAWQQPGVADFATTTGLLWYDASEVGRGLVVAVTIVGPRVIEL
jgi:hypothetical protein